MAKIIAGLVFTSLLQAATIVGVGRGVEQSYVVKKGDSLWKISQIFYGTGFRAEQLKRHNGLKSDLITEGQKIALPTLFLRLMVSMGDSLSTISEKYFCGASRYKVLAKYNRIPSPYHIREGQILRLPLHSVGGLIPCDSLIVRGGGTAEPVKAKASGRKSAKNKSIVSTKANKTSEADDCRQVKTNQQSACAKPDYGIVHNQVASKRQQKEQSSHTVVKESANPFVAPKISAPELQKWTSDKKLLAADKSEAELVVSPKRKKSKEGFRGLFASLKRIGGSQETWQRRDDYEKKNPRNFSVGMEFFDYKPNKPVVSNASAGPVKSIMPIYRISQGVGRSGDVSVLFGHWDSSETDVLSSVYKNDYSLAGATISVTELLDQRVGFRAEAGLIEYVHKASVSNKALFGTISSTARNMGYLFSVGLRYRINQGLDLSLTWMKFGGRFRHPDFGPTPVETEMGSSAFGFGVHYRF